MPGPSILLRTMPLAALSTRALLIACWCAPHQAKPGWGEQSSRGSGSAAAVQTLNSIRGGAQSMQRRSWRRPRHPSARAAGSGARRGRMAPVHGAARRRRRAKAHPTRPAPRQASSCWLFVSAGCASLLGLQKHPVIACHRILAARARLLRYALICSCSHLMRARAVCSCFATRRGSSSRTSPRPTWSGSLARSCKSAAPSSASRRPYVFPAARCSSSSAWCAARQVARSAPWSPACRR